MPRNVIHPALALTLTLLLVFGLAADASTRSTLRGPIEPTGSAAVRTNDVERQHRRLTAYRMRFREVPLSCADGTTSSVDLGTGPLVYRRAHRHLSLDVVYATPVGDEGPEDPGGWSMRATVISARRIEGTVRFFDREFQGSDGSTHDCESGRLAWTATR
jgi:hypothetical protein